MDNKRSIGILPDDALINLFKFVPPLDRLRLKTVCRRWENVFNLSWNDCNTLSVIYRPNRKCRKMSTMSVEELKAMLEYCGSKVNIIRLAANDVKKTPVEYFCEDSLIKEPYDDDSDDNNDSFSYVTYEIEKLVTVITLGGSSYVLPVSILEIFLMIITHCLSPKRVTFELAATYNFSHQVEKFGRIISTWIISNPKIEVLEIVCKEIGELLLNSDRLPYSIKNLSLCYPCLDSLKQQVETLEHLPSLKTLTLDYCRFKGSKIIRNVLNNPEILNKIISKDWFDPNEFCNVMSKFREFGQNSDNFECPNITKIIMVSEKNAENFNNPINANKSKSGVRRSLNFTSCSNLTYDQMLQILTVVPNLKDFSYTDQYATVNYMVPLVNFFILRAISNQRNLRLCFNTNQAVEIRDKQNRSYLQVKFFIWDCRMEASNLNYIIANSPDSAIIFRKYC